MVFWHIEGCLLASTEVDVSADKAHSRLVVSSETLSYIHPAETVSCACASQLASGAQVLH